jgi:hypothetical protein
MSVRLMRSTAGAAAVVPDSASSAAGPRRRTTRIAPERSVTEWTRGVMAMSSFLTAAPVPPLPA